MAQVRLSAILAMLRKCADLLGWREARHQIVLDLPRESVFFPSGAHGAADPEVQLRHVLHLVRKLGIEECAALELPQLASRLKNG